MAMESHVAAFDNVNCRQTNERRYTVMSMSMANLKGPIMQYAPLLLSFDSAKSVLFYYVLLTQGVKLQRHIRARGIITSAKELYTWTAQVLQFSL